MNGNIYLCEKEPTIFSGIFLYAPNNDDVVLIEKSDITNNIECVNRQ